MLRLFKNRIFIGAMCLLLAGVLAFVFLPRLYSAQASTTQIVKLIQTVEHGTVITDDMLTVTEVGSYGLPDEVIRSKSEIIGLVAGETVYAGEYLWRDCFINKEAYKAVSSNTGFGLSNGTYLLTISLPSESAGIAGILRAGDTVDVYGYTDENGTTVVSKALTDIKVYDVLNKKVASMDELDAELEASVGTDLSDYDFAPAYVVFIVNEDQAKTLIGLEREKSLHLTLRKAGA